MRPIFFHRYGPLPLPPVSCWREILKLLDGKLKNRSVILHPAFLRWREGKAWRLLNIIRNLKV